MALVASRLEIRRANEGFPLGTPYSDLCAAGPVVRGPILASTQMRRDQGLAWVAVARPPGPGDDAVEPNGHRDELRNRVRASRVA
jgi:hypothetical protein